MNNTAIFFKYGPKKPWQFAGHDVDIWDQAGFAAENPNGEVLMIDLEFFVKHIGPAGALKNEPTTVELDDGRIVDVFPATGGVQVYTPDKKHGYELTLPAVDEQVLAETGSDTLVYRMIG